MTAPMSRRASLAWLGATLAGRAFAQGDAAGAWPAKPIRIVVPYAAGGGTDLLARTWANLLQATLGQNVIVDNRAGGNGVIGTVFAAKAPADGYTVYIATYGFPVTPLLMHNAGYTVADFAPVIRTGAGPLAVVVEAGSPIRSMGELVAAARARPGALNVGTLGDGSQEQMGAQRFQQVAGVKLTEVPYKGGGPALIDLIGGSIQVMFEGLPTVMGHLRAGKVRALAVTGAKRSSQLPDVPTVTELGLAGSEVYSWTGFLVPAKTPRAIVDRLNAAFRKGLADPALMAEIGEKFGSDPAGGTPEDFADFLAARVRENVEVLRSLGVALQPGA